MSLPLDGTLTDAQRERLSRFLRPPALTPDAFEGLAAALAVGPTTVLPSLWVARVWDPLQGRRGPAFANIDEANEVMALLMLAYNGVVAERGPAASRPVTPLATRPDAQAVGDAFAVGFCVGVSLAQDAWQPLERAHPEWLGAFIRRPADPAAMDDALSHIAGFWRAPEGDALWARIRADLEFFTPPYPQVAVERVLQHRDALAPHWVAALEAVADDPALASGEDDYVLHQWAAIFLAAWRDTRAYRPLLRMMRLPYGTVEMLFGDLLFETIGRAIASVCDGDVAPLGALAEDASVSYWVRSTMLDAWALRVREGDAPAAPLEAVLQRIGPATEEAERSRRRTPADDPSMLEAVAMTVLDLRLHNLLPMVHGWFDAGLIDPKMVGRAEYDREWQAPARRSSERGYIADPIAETRWWAGWTEDEYVPPAPYMRPTAKIGRNDPCPCGSGRKYKKCHGAN